MSFYSPPWDSNLEPNSGNVKHWLDNLYSKFQPVEQSRWNQANIDSLFYAGSQAFVNRYFNFTPGNSYQNFHFNLIQQPVNMVTGYQRQHRRSINYIPSEGADPETTDQYTRIITHVANVEGINEAFSKACELAAISGMVLIQPYLDYIGDDPAQGSLKVKVWEYNSFLVDPYFRNPDMSDANFVWCQEYISKQEAERRFPGKLDKITPMSGSPQRYGSFYFLPENHNMARSDLMILSYVWYKHTRKKKRLYSKTRNQFFDYAENNPKMDEILYHIPDLEQVEVDTPTWKCAIVLNDQLIYQDNNPLGFDTCPFVPVFWNYDPHINYADLRVRSLVRTMRDPQFLMNRRIILNHDISESSINSGWMRKSGAVANEDNLKKSGQGWDVIINEGYEMGDVQKIIPNAVPPSDMQLADQLAKLIFSTAGVDIENWSGQDDGNVSSLTVLLKQGASLMVLQKYFDQWDYSFKLLGDKLLQIVLNNWNEAKVGLIIGEEPSPHFFSRIFAKYQVVVEEGLNTATQRQQEFQQTLELNAALGGIIPASYLASIATLQGKKKLMELLQQQEQQQAAVQEQATTIQHTFEEAKLKEMYSRAVSNIAMARERHGRTESNLGLFEERLSMIANNNSIAVKNKVEAISKLLEALSLYGGEEVKKEEKQIDNMEDEKKGEVDREKVDSKRMALSNEFVMSILNSAMGPGQSGQMEQMGQEAPE